MLTRHARPDRLHRGPLRRRATAPLETCSWPAQNHACRRTASDLSSPTEPVCCPAYSAGVPRQSAIPRAGNLSPVTDWCMEAAGSVDGLRGEREVAHGRLRDRVRRQRRSLHRRARRGSGSASSTSTRARGASRPSRGLRMSRRCRRRRMAAAGPSSKAVRCSGSSPPRTASSCTASGPAGSSASRVDSRACVRNMPLSTPFNTAITIKLACTDVDGDPITFRQPSAPAKGQLGALQRRRHDHVWPAGRLRRRGLVRRSSATGSRRDGRHRQRSRSTSPDRAGGGGGGGGRSAERARQRQGRVLRRPGLQRRQRGDPARRRRGQGQPDRRELRRARGAVPDAGRRCGDELGRQGQRRSR